jgi:hypothetical protein
LRAFGAAIRATGYRRGDADKQRSGSDGKLPPLAKGVDANSNLGQYRRRSRIDHYNRKEDIARGWSPHGSVARRRGGIGIAIASGYAVSKTPASTICRNMSSIDRCHGR